MHVKVEDCRSSTSIKTLVSVATGSQTLTRTRLRPYVYSGPNPMTKFYDHVMSESREICHIVTGAACMLPLTEKQAAEYARAVWCSNCGDIFSKDNHKTHHHCHISGKYLFPACNKCNLNLKPVTCTSKLSRKRNYTSTDEWAKERYRENFFLPVLFHSLK